MIGLLCFVLTVLLAADRSRPNGAGNGIFSTRQRHCRAKPSSDKYAGKMMIANSAAKPPAARAAYNRKKSDGLLMMIFR
jgi:hypothetical protein